MKQIYVKTLLYAYPNIPKIIKRIDELVTKKAISSMTIYTDCREQCENIIKLTVQKAILFEIGFYMEKILSRLVKEEKQLIKYKYFKVKNKKDLIVDFTSRNYYRKQEKLFNHICNCFEWLNLTDDWFIKNCKKVPYIRKLLQSVILYHNTQNTSKKKLVVKEVA